MSEAERLAALWLELQRASKAIDPLPNVIVVVDGESAHVQISDGGADDPAALYEIGQRAMFTLATYLERIRPMVEGAALANPHRNQQSS